MEFRISHKATMWVLFLGVLMAALDIAIVGPALPSVRSHFQLDDRVGSWMVTLFVLGNLISMPIWAKLSDLHGRRLIYSLNLFLFCIGSMVVAFAPDLNGLLAGRLLQGLGAGGIFPVASATIGDLYPPERRGRMLGLIGMVFGIAFIIGPIIGAELLRFGWRYVFLGPIPLGLALIPFALKHLPARPKIQSKKRLDILGVIFITIFLTALCLGVNQLDTRDLFLSIQKVNTWPFLLTALVFGMAVFKRELNSKSPILQLALLSRRQIALAVALTFGAGCMESAVMFIPSLLVPSFLVTPTQASYMLLPIVIAMGIGAPLFGRGLDRFGARPVLMLGTISLAFGLLIIGNISLTHTNFIVAGIFGGLGLAALVGAPIRYIVLAETDVNNRASAQAMISLFTQIGQILSAALVGAVAFSLGGGVRGYSAVFNLFGILALSLVFISFFLKKGKAVSI